MRRSNSNNDREMDLDVPKYGFSLGREDAASELGIPFLNRVSLAVEDRVG